MIRYKTTNYTDVVEEIIIEIEEEFTNTLLYGLNISIENEEGLWINTTLSYTQVLDLYKMLTEKMCSTQMQMLDILNYSPINWQDSWVKPSNDD